MICKVCGNKFDEDRFSVCPFCLTVIDEKESTEGVIAPTENSEAVEEVTSPEIIELESTDSLIATENSPKEENISSVENASEEENHPNIPYAQDTTEVKLNDLEDLSVRTKNVLARNGVLTFKQLIMFLERHKISELHGAGSNAIDEVNALITKFLSGDLVLSVNNQEDIEPQITLEDKVIEAIENGQQTNIKIDQINDLGARGYNVLIRNNVNDMLSLAIFLKANPISTIRGVGAAFADEIPRIFDRFLSGDYSATESLKKSLFENIESRPFQIYLRRANGETLQEIAENPGDLSHEALSRERIRQIEAKFYKKYIKTLEQVVEDNWGNQKFFSAQELRDLYDNEDIGTVLVAMLSSSDTYSFMDFADCFIKNEEYGNKNVEHEILSLVTDYIGDGIDLNDNLENIGEMLIVNGYDFVGICELINLLDKHKFKFYKDFVTKSKVTYAQFCKGIILEKFPDGIKLNQSNNGGNSDDLNLLRKIAKEKYGDLGIPDNDRAFSSRLSDVLILSGRGKAIPEENIQIDFEILNQIKEFIDNYEVEKIYYSELFANFEGILTLTSNVDNHYFLHGVLMLYYPTDYDYYKDYLIRKDRTGKAISVAERIRNYIHEVNRPVTRKELKERFPGFTDIMILLHIESDPILTQWSYDSYYALDLFSYDANEINTLRATLTNKLDEYGGFISDNVLYSATATEMRDFLKRNNITQPIHLFHMCETLFKNEYIFRFPNIGRIGLLNSFNIRDIVLYLLDYPEVLSYKKYMTLANKMKWAPITISNTFYNIEESYIRISLDEYKQKELFEVEETAISQIKKYLFSILENKEYVSLVDFADFSQLPEIDYEWNIFLLESIISNYVPELKIICPDAKDRRYQKSLVISSDSTIETYTELVAYIFKKNGYTSLSESKFRSFMVLNGLSTIIPKEIENSKYFKVQDGIYQLA